MCVHVGGCACVCGGGGFACLRVQVSVGAGVTVQVRRALQLQFTALRCTHVASNGRLWGCNAKALGQNAGKVRGAGAVP